MHAELWSILREKGKLIGSHDLIIAATAVTHNFGLITNNIDEFKRVPGLKLLNT